MQKTKEPTKIRGKFLLKKLYFTLLLQINKFFNNLYVSIKGQGFMNNQGLGQVQGQCLGQIQGQKS